MSSTTIYTESIIAMPPRKKLNIPPIKNKFTVATLEALADDLQKGRIPLPRVTITDSLQAGLRAIIRNTGNISFHVNYEVGESRPYLKLGDHPDMTIAEARSLARTVRSLADLGIDPTEGLHTRLIRELRDKGTKWRP